MEYPNTNILFIDVFQNFTYNYKKKKKKNWSTRHEFETNLMTKFNKILYTSW